ncbi:hypothetical protein AB0C89_09640 [Streptomyces sp. NPDC048491]|uniref:hypothetical protein n=1 Tax=Streptomyces sp. NPDC048491 TaxID=3157207 RepID=UPI003422FAAD
MDERLQKLARSSPNFGVLYPLKPLLSLYGAQAEATVFTNPNSSLVQAGQFGEALAGELVTRIGMGLPRDRVTSELACPVRQLGKMSLCPNPIRKSSARTSCGSRGTAARV